METDIALSDVAAQQDSSQVGGSPDRQESQERTEFSLPQADGGKDAWLFLAACFVVEALVWGRYRSSNFLLFPHLCL
jgi:hypothetical protein